MEEICFAENGKMAILFTKEELALLRVMCTKANKDFKNAPTTIELLNRVEKKIVQADLEAYILGVK